MFRIPKINGNKQNDYIVDSKGYPYKVIKYLIQIIRFKEFLVFHIKVNIKVLVT